MRKCIKGIRVELVPTVRRRLYFPTMKVAIFRPVMLKREVARVPIQMREMRESKFCCKLVGLETEPRRGVEGSLKQLKLVMEWSRGLAVPRWGRSLVI